VTITFKLSRKPPARAEIHAVPVCSDQIDDEPEDLDWAVLKSRGFEGRPGQVQIVSGANGRPVAVVGVGKSAEVDPKKIRRASIGLAKAAKRHKTVASSLLDVLPFDADRVSAARAHAEGLVMGAYSYNDLKSDGKPNEITTVTVAGGGGAKVQAALDLGAQVGEAVGFARDLVNEPGGSLTPAEFARKAQDMARSKGLRARVMTESAIKRAKLGGLLGVNRGSDQAPRFVELTYEPEGRAKGHLALVGKGLTFDAGGLSIKTGTGMMTMKCDMGGGAAVIGAMSAVAGVGPPCKVSAYVPMTDNMLGGDATRPGDVLTIKNGKTVEVLNTDAEGRLILADALSVASAAKPDAIVDLATLTGACMVALGPNLAGLMSNNDDWAGQVEAASKNTGEQAWRLPLPPEYRKQLDSSVADLKNIGGPYGGALTAGLFLQEFVANDIPWAHLDIAGVAFLDADNGDMPKGGTGFGVRLLLDLIANFTPPGK
jgi:leucyl aminopeptidase